MYQRQKNPKTVQTHTHQREAASQTEKAQSARQFTLSPASIMKLQRTIGNQAVQRLISDRLQRDNAKNAPQKEDSTPGYLAKITTHDGRKLKGNSKIDGFEGDIEVVAISTEFNASMPGKPKDKGLRITLSKYVDDSSPWLLNAAAKGEHIASAVFLRVVNDPEAGIRVAPTMQFGDGLIANMRMGSADYEGGKEIEQVDIDFPEGLK